MSTILDLDLEEGYDEEEDEDYFATAEEIAAADEDEETLLALRMHEEKEKLKKKIRSKAIAGADIISEDEVDMFELPPEVEEDDLSHLEAGDSLDPEAAQRLSLEDQVMSARVAKTFSELNNGKDFSGSLASLCRSAGKKSKGESSLGKRKGPEADLIGSSDTSLASLTGTVSKKKSSQSKKQKTKKTLNSWELPAASPVSVEELMANTSAEEGEAADSVSASTPSVLSSSVAGQFVSDEGKYLVKDVAEFAGQKIEMVREITKGSAAEKAIVKKKAKSSLEKLVEGLEGGNSELSTIEKSSWDWQLDKREVGDAQELAQAAKDGYVAKQNFLAAAEDRERQKLKTQQRLAAGANR